MRYQLPTYEEFLNLAIELKTSYHKSNPQRKAFITFFEKLVFAQGQYDFHLMTELPPRLNDEKYKNAYIFIEPTSTLFYINNGEAEEVTLEDKENFKSQLSEMMGEHNSARLNHRLVKHLLTENGGQMRIKDVSILAGACILELETIRKEYTWSSARESKGYIYNSGSQVFTILDTKLNSEQNPLTDDECLIYLFKFYEYVKNAPVAKIKQLEENKEHLLKQTEKYLQEVKRREKNRIELLAYGTPKLEALQKNVIALLPEYEKATACRWFTNSKRKSLLEFINLINETRRILYSENPSQKREKDEEECAYLQSCNVLLGVLLFALIKIKKEYKLLSPKGSELFKSCLEAINAKSLDSIESDKKILWLKSLSRHIDEVNNKLRVKKDELIKWQLEIDKYVVEEEIKRTRPSRPVAYAAKATGYAVQWGISFGLAQAAKTYALPAIGGALSGGLTGLIGLVIYSATGLIVMTGLGRFIRDNLMPPAVAYVYAWVLEKIGKAVENKTQGVATYTFTATKQGFRTLIGHPALKREDREFIYEWINTLLKMPNNIVSEKEKYQIRSVLGIENEIDDSFIMLESNATEEQETIEEKSVAVARVS